MILQFSFCSNPKSETFDQQAIQQHEIELDTLMNQIRDLPVKESPSEFITLYIKIQQILDILPDTVQIQYIKSGTLIQLLNEVGAYDEAIKLMWKHVSLYNDINDQDSINNGLGIYGALAGLYKKVGKMDSANILYRMAMNAAKFGPNGRKATHVNNLGLYFRDQGNLDTAMFYFQLSDSLYSTDTSYPKKFHGSIKDNIATIYEARGEFEKARKIYTENLSLYKTTNAHFKLLKAAISLANSEVELGNYSQIDSLFRFIFKVSDSLKYKNKHINDLYLFEVMAKYYNKTGNYKNAFIYTKKLFHLSDSLINLEKTVYRATTNQLAKSASDHFDHELQVVRSAKEREVLRVRMLIWIIILIVLGATITPTILFFYYKQRDRLRSEIIKADKTTRLLVEEKLKTRNQEKQLLNLELECKMKDLADMAISLSMKQEWAAELAQKVALIESSKGNQRSREFKKLKTEIQRHVYINNQLSMLSNNIDSLNKEFYDKLKKQFPDLSKTDIKLCSYFKLNISNHQVAQLQNIDPSSVKVSRYRLKKKLGLDAGQNLDEFLQAF